MWEIPVEINFTKIIDMIYNKFIKLDKMWKLIKDFEIKLTHVLKSILYVL